MNNIMQVPLLDLKAQYSQLKPQLSNILLEVAESQNFILGPYVQLLEERIAGYSGCKFGVGVSSGSDALLISLMAENIGPGDEVITTPYTFFATAGAITRVGATPVFVDIEPGTFNLRVEDVSEKITPRTKAVIPVHLFGQCAEMTQLIELAKKFQLIIIEDAAQAIGAECVVKDKNGDPSVKRAGSMGDYGCFSFFPSKNLGAFGDGGMVVVNDEDKAERLRVLRAHGSKPKYVHKVVGGNFRLDVLQAAVLLVKLEYLDTWTAARQQNAWRYDTFFADSGLVKEGKLTSPATVWKTDQSVPLQTPVGHYHIYNQYVVSTPERDHLQSYLKSKGIGTAIYYPLALHMQECFSSLGYNQGDFPVSEAASRETLALPVYAELTKEQQIYVAQAVVEGLSK